MQGMNRSLFVTMNIGRNSDHITYQLNGALDYYLYFKGVFGTLMKYQYS